MKISKPKISRARGILFIDGIPAEEIGAIVTRHSNSRINTLNEWAYCRRCKTDHPIAHMVTPPGGWAKHENRRGYSSICLDCAAKEDEKRM